MSKTLKIGWYVLYVRSSQEKKVYNLLQEKEVEAFLPMTETIRQWSDRKKVISVPLFPSYIFVRINNTKDFAQVLSINGACSFIRFGSEYAIVKDEEIQKIKILVDAEDIKEIAKNQEIPKIGDRMKIYDGSLSGLECEVLKINNTNKIIVRVDSLQQNIVATIPPSYLSSMQGVA